MLPLFLTFFLVSPLCYCRFVLQPNVIPRFPASSSKWQAVLSQMTSFKLSPPLFSRLFFLSEKPLQESSLRQMAFLNQRKQMGSMDTTTLPQKISTALKTESSLHIGYPMSLVVSSSARSLSERSECTLCGVLSCYLYFARWDYLSNVRYAQTAENVGFEFALTQIRFMSGYGAVSRTAFI